ncbi:MAG: hypothetical protein Q3961_04490, partial [Bifidobacteriaceae bacterium]|nr:hypothetical protein [Bifidobacteriaceae bacterium]
MSPLTSLLKAISVDESLANFPHFKGRKLPLFSNFHRIGTMPKLPENLQVGWVQHPEFKKRFSIGVFTAKREFIQLGVVDEKLRVFFGNDVDMDLQPLNPDMLFSKYDNDVVARISKKAKFSEFSVNRLYDIRRVGRDASSLTLKDFQSADSRSQFAIEAEQGGVFYIDKIEDEPVWLSSWIMDVERDSYTLEQLRLELPENLRVGLSLRDAVTISCFASYLIPSNEGLVLGFGASHIMSMLNERIAQTPLNAIVRCVENIRKAQELGYRVSGLELYFIELMQDSGALDKNVELFDDSNIEKLSLDFSQNGMPVFRSDDSVNINGNYKLFKIEGALHRFNALSEFLDMNNHVGMPVNEDYADVDLVRRIDHMLIVNPMLTMFSDNMPVDILEHLEDYNYYVQELLDYVLSTVDDVRNEELLSSQKNTVIPEEMLDLLADNSREWLFRRTLAR